MEKTIKINTNTTFKIDNNVGWALKYRNQFGHDILPDILPIVNAATELVAGMARTADFTDIKSVLASIDVDDWNDALFRLSGLEFATFLNITWTMAKTADEDIPEVEEWLKGFSTFPMDIIAPEVVKHMIKGIVSSKNLKRLRDMIPKAELL